MIELDLSEQIAALRSTFGDIRSVVDVDRLRADIADLSEQAGAPDLWDDTEHAQKVTSALSHRQSELARIDSIERRLDDLEVLVELANERGRPGFRRRGARRARRACRRSSASSRCRRCSTASSTPRPAVVTIRAGAGGVDAADFAEMLLRMYLRWAEQHKYPTSVLDACYAEEAGIKSATFEVDAPYAFGTLSVEAGTHRLVRMSPSTPPASARPASPRSRSCR